MSGGTWEYRQHVVKDTLADVADTVREDLPNLSLFFEQLAEKTFELINELDRHYAGDTDIDDLPAFEEQALARLAVHIFNVSPIKGSYDWARRRMIRHRAHVTHPALGAVFMFEPGSGDVISVDGNHPKLDPFSDDTVIPAFGWKEV
jgi:hypothetical protein